MAKVYGTAFSGTDGTKLAPGTAHDAGVRRFRNVFDLAVNGGGGTVNTPVVARVREGSCVEAFKLSSTVSLSGITFTLGTIDAPAKYATAFAGPGAGATVSFPILVAELAADSLDLPEEIILTPSGNLPATGTVVSSLFASKR